MGESTTLLANQAPWWEPGTAGGYHGFTLGHLVGEVVCRVTGMSMGTFFAREIAGPLGADYHIGTPAECDPRVSLLVTCRRPARHRLSYDKRYCPWAVLAALVGSLLPAWQAGRVSVVEELRYDRNGSLLWDGKDDQAASGTKATIELPADLAMLDSRTIDRVIEAVFDRLGQYVIVLRVRVPSPLPLHSVRQVHP